MISSNLISKKRDGLNLRKDDIELFFNEYLSEKVTDAQMSAMLMAIYFNGMNEEETFSLVFLGFLIAFLFLDNLPGYSMIIGGKDGELMSDVRIFSKGKQESQTSIHSKTGTLSTLADAFLLTLHDGEIHELENKDFTNYRRIIFETHKIIIPADDILLNRRDSSNRTDREMTIPMIIKKVDAYEKKLSVVQKRLKGSFFRTIGDSIIPSSIEEGIKKFVDWFLSYYEIGKMK